MDKHLTNAQLNELLPAETKEIFEVVGTQKRTTGSVRYAQWGDVNYKTLTVNQARQLVAIKFPYLKEREKKTGK